MDALSRLADLATQERTKTATLRSAARSFVADLVKALGTDGDFPTEIIIRKGNMKLAFVDLIDNGSARRSKFWCFWVVGRGYYAIDAEVDQKLKLTSSGQEIPVIGTDELREFSTVAQEFVDGMTKKLQQETAEVENAITSLGGAR